MSLNSRQLQILKQYHDKGGTALFFEALPYPTRYDLVNSCNKDEVKNICINTTNFLNGSSVYS